MITTYHAYKLEIYLHVQSLLQLFVTYLLLLTYMYPVPADRSRCK